MKVLGADLGGTRMRAAQVAPSGEVIRRAEAATPTDAPTPAAFLDLLHRLVGGCDHAVLGIPGRIHHETGVLEHAPNLPRAWSVSLSEASLSEALGIPVHTVNDADLAAIGEGYYGAGRDYGDVLFMTFSTGVGGGVLLNRRLAHGRRSIAEVGWQVVDLDAAGRGEPCHLEHLASGTALGRLGAAAGIDGGAPEVVRRMRAGDAAASAVFARVVRAAAVGVANACFLYSPEVVVVGGGLGLMGPEFLDPIQTWLDAHGPPGMRIPVVRAALGVDAALVGAAGWSRAMG